jgi:peptide/nickel transport system permease protein
VSATAPPVSAGEGAVFRVRRREWLHVVRTAVRTPRGMVGVTMTLLVALVAAVGPFVAPHSSTEFVASPFAKSTSSLPFGADVLGRDVLSRVLAGGWQLLLFAAAATAIGVGVGAVAGVSAAYLRGWADGTIMRVVDVVLAFPQLVFALLLISVIGPQAWLLVLAVGLSHAPQVARVLRAAALDVSERDYVKAVEILGVRPARIMRHEVLPNLLTPLMVEIGLRMTYSIVIISGLSFIGFGLQPPSPNWGLMINENRIGLTLNFWGVLAPSVLIALLTVGLNTLTDAVARVGLGVERADMVMMADALREPEVGVA